MAYYGPHGALVVVYNAVDIFHIVAVQLKLIKFEHSLKQLLKLVQVQAGRLTLKLPKFCKE